MKILVTGASGFTGHHMISHLLSLPGTRAEVFGLYNATAPHPLTGCTYLQGDLRNRDETRALVRSISPDAVIHLAGLNKGTLDDLLQVNVVATQNLLDAVVQERPDSRVLVTGSSAEYGYAGTAPIREDAPLRPVGSYGISKVAEDLLARSFAFTHSLAVAVVRPFNLIGPGQPPSFVCGRIVAQALEIEAGIRDTMLLGNTDSRRDFLDVRDTVSGYRQILFHERFEEHFSGKAVNIGSGTATSIREVLTCVERVTKRNYTVETPDNPGTDLIPTQRSDNTRITTATGWRPSIPICRSIEDMLDHGRAAGTGGIRY
ncbi:hypothetical protein ABH15_12745 [Methanoculleus taiwanensis]|uniref:NAD-dependent epimerase/dehydratase domain-containing protein n=1 Tax=Methanoculleus taiwanensis TaxID=1550565 RepID=A0A498GY91_9EURY|nr:GDP-mannose 4,6-dehydratase [Methanoculleus taiwanensis]RXE55095.1 hypothetical protein ABH15_12745 [Methanoculleus taiwanensis]